ncbi:uncharacterized protein LOC119576677 [Penaeus monodon]|uniref:uncharacterized protein LOC119576677 n=1 Tax=Penaeus monodon TaxID=6687 RepID=UPI0018A6FD24|nr:uncharacterized protein LOC119576677 [Penaeus monodon]
MEMFLKREGFSEKFPLSPSQNRYILGRNPTCDIKFTSPFISRQHCEIKRVPPHGTLMIRNLKATNVTYVDGLELRDLEMIAELRPGCQIGLGVPLSHATDEGIRNSQYVFLRLCEPEDQNENLGNMSSLNETVNFSPGQRGRRLSNSRPPGDTVTQTEKSEDARRNAGRTGPFCMEYSETPQEGGIMTSTSATSFDPQKTSYSHSGSENDYVMSKLKPNSSIGFIPCIQSSTSAATTRPSLVASANVPQSSGATKPPTLSLAQPEVSCNDSDVRSLPLLTCISSAKRKESLELFDNNDLKVQVNVDIPKSTKTLPRRNSRDDCKGLTSHQSEFSNQWKDAASVGDEMRKSSHSISGLPLHVEETKQGPSSLQSEGQYSSPIVQSMETHRREKRSSGTHGVSQIQQDSSMRSEGDACNRASPSFPVQHVLEVLDVVSSSKPVSSSEVLEVNSTRKAKASEENLRKSTVEDTVTVMESSSNFLYGKRAPGLENQSPFQHQHIKAKHLLQTVNNLTVQTPVLGAAETSACVKATKEQTNFVEKRNEFDTNKDQKDEPKDCGQTDLITIDEFLEGDIIDLTQQDPEPDNSVEKRTEDEEQDLMACFVVDLMEEEKGETASEGSAKRKRNTGEETIKSLSSTSADFKDVKKARLIAPAVSNLNSREDSGSDSDSGVLKTLRNSKLKRSIVLDSDSETEMEKSKSLNEKAQPKENFRMKSEVNAWAKRDCQVAIERLPSSVVKGAVSGKEIINDKKSGLTVETPPMNSRSRILTSKENKTSGDTGSKVSTVASKEISKIDLPCITYGLDSDDDLPDLNNVDLKPVRGSVCSENIIVRRRSTEDDDKRKGKDPPKAFNDGRGSLDRQYSNPPMKHHIGALGRKESEPPGKRHKRQSSRDSQLSDAQETRDSQGLRQQKVNRTDKNPNSTPEVSSSKAGRSYKNSGESSDDASSKDATKCAAETSASVLSVPGSKSANEDVDYIFCKPRPDALVKIKKEKGVQESVVNMKIKTEKIEKDQWHLNIKREPEDKEKASTEKEKVRDTCDDEDDDVLIMYSQVDEPIWLSSDEEDSSTSVTADVSFGPLPPSPELGIEELFATEDQQKEAGTADKAKGGAVTEVDIDEDDQWFPVLSQSFWDDDIEETKKSSKTDEPVAGPSSTSSCAKQNDELEDDDKWLELSQGFMDDDAEFDNKSSKDKDATDSSFEVSQCDCRKKQEQGSQEISAHRSNTKDRENLHEKHTKTRTTKIITPPQKSRRKKGPSLRENLTAKYNLQSYKATVEQKKESYHLVSRTEEDKKKESSHRKSHLITSEPRKEENISVQKKPSHKEGGDQAKSRSTVAAKVTSKNRSEKLIDINIFPSPEVPKPQLRKKYKIPKNDTTKKADSKDNKKGEGSSHVLDASTKRAPPAPEINTLENSERETKSTPMQKDSEKVVVTVDQKISSIIKDKDKGNMKAKKHVRFPSQLEDLVKVLYISPRKNAERLGALSVKAKEVLPKELLFLKYKIPNNYFDQFIYFVCRWNYDWLDSYRIMQEKHANGKLKEVRPPPVVQNTTYPTLILYDSYNDYKEIFSTLMYYEVWEHVYQDWLQYRNTNMWLTAQIDVIQPPGIDREVNAPKFWMVKVITLITQEQSSRNHHPRQGSLVALKLHEGKRRVVILGYVDNIIKSRKRNVTKELDMMVPQGEVCLLLCMRVTKDTIQTVKLGKMIYVSNVSYIRPATRTWEGLCKLPQSPLCGDILKPSEEVFKCTQHPGEYIIPDMPLNNVQKKAVVEVSSKCTVDELVPKISLIHGPPGTGKTRTITALIAQITKSCRENKRPCRILLCAPSNAAVDELTLRLIKLKEIGLSLRLVRVGVRESISSELREYTLDAFVQRQVKIELSTPKNLSTRQEWERKRYMVKQAADALEKARKENRNKEEIKAMETRLNELVRGKTEFERSFHSQPNSQERYKLQQKWQEQFLLGAEVITVTLGGCVSGVMQEVLGKLPHAFTCCIIDEAGQCKETETWLPLLYGVRKLVLVGDHKQLPATVISQLAQNKNLKQSLFERFFYRYVIELQMDNLIHSLNVQYRMHPEIADWPCKHFYLNKLVTSPEIVMERTYGLRPYIVFDLKTSQEQKSQNNELYNPAEASLIRILLEAIEPDIAQQKVAIITPYQCQKYKLEEKLAKFFGRINLVINTIDAFQVGLGQILLMLTLVEIGLMSEGTKANRAGDRCSELERLLTLFQVYVL